MWLFPGRREERDVLNRLDLPLIVFHRRFLEGFLAAAMTCGGLFLLMPGTSLWSPTFAYVRQIPEWAWGEAFLSLGVAHAFALRYGSQPWVPAFRVGLLSIGLVLYVAMATLIAAVNAVSWHLYTTFVFQVGLTFVCLARARYEHKHARAARHAGLA